MDEYGGEFYSLFSATNDRLSQTNRFSQENNENRDCGDCPPKSDWIFNACNMFPAPIKFYQQRIIRLIHMIPTDY
ncbi:hypothetical protein KKC32_04600 [Patescibacteria group bacterium]|nr:hypothetical protein [Patescibacteria group bacterium]